MEFTKGEWRVVGDSEDSRKLHIISDDGGVRICTIPHYWGNSKANAHLIAAAPDMYEALKQLIERCESPTFKRAYEAIGQGGLVNSFSAEAKQALAKAEGKE